MPPKRHGTPASQKRTRTGGGDDRASSLPSTKKRKLNAPSVASPSDTKPTNIFGSAASSVWSFGKKLTGFGAGSQKENIPLDSTYEVPDSNDERGGEETPSKRTSSKIKTGTKAAVKDVFDVYDVPGSEDELTTSDLTMRRGRQKAATPGTPRSKGKALTMPSTTGGSTGKRRGRPKKIQPEEVTGTARGTPTKNRSGRRPREQEVKESAAEGGSDYELEETTISNTRRTSARREKGTSMSEWIQDIPKIKGILTPQKHRGPRRRKSVAFNPASQEREAEVFFEDVHKKAPKSVGPVVRKTQAVPPASVSASRAKRRRATEDAGVVADSEGSGEDEEDDEEAQEDENDEVCVVCSKPDSKPKNEIILCDGCDMAVHQKCYGIKTIPIGDWFCKDCSQDVTTKTKRAQTGKHQVVDDPGEDPRPDIPNFDQHMLAMQRVLLDRCAGRRRIKFQGQDEAYSQAFQLIKQTVSVGEGNSMLIIGARGSGKTTMVESIVSELSQSHKSEFHVVRLNGFIHTDDKLALREIWRQLGKEMEVEDELVYKTTNYADTLASLLALLSHPSEIAESQEGVTSRSVVFLIDEFDLFAGHTRQTLLYNLFDIAQARKAPIAVVGLTTRIDVVESLEKRVKSRFSHRYVYLSLAQSIPAYWAICKQGLTINDENMKTEGIDVDLEGHSEYWEWWREKVEALNESQRLRDHLEAHFYSTKSVPAFLSTCIIPLSRLSPKYVDLSLGDLTKPPYSIPVHPPDSKLHILESLSDLDLSMLIAAARLDIVAHTDTVNFAMAYDEYSSLMGRQRAQSANSGMLALGSGAPVWGHGAAGSAWERLVSFGLLIPAGLGSGARGSGPGAGAAAAGHGGLEARMWKVDAALEEIPAAVKLNAVLAKWCNEI